jgi:hypothetical protein
MGLWRAQGIRDLNGNGSRRNGTLFFGENREGHHLKQILRM